MQDEAVHGIVIVCLFEWPIFFNIRGKWLNYIHIVLLLGIIQKQIEKAQTLMRYYFKWHLIPVFTYLWAYGMLVKKKPKKIK